MSQFLQDTSCTNEAHTCSVHSPFCSRNLSAIADYTRVCLPGGNILGIYSCVELDCSKRCDTSHMEGHRVGRPTLMCPADPMAGRARAKPWDIFGMTVRGSGNFWAARVTHGTYLWYTSANMLLFWRLYGPTPTYFVYVRSLPWCYVCACLELWKPPFITGGAQATTGTGNQRRDAYLTFGSMGLLPHQRTRLRRRKRGLSEHPAFLPRHSLACGDHDHTFLGRQSFPYLLYFFS